MKTVVTLISSLLLTATASAQVNIEIPDNVQVLAVNAKRAHVEGGLFSSTKTLTLEDGENQVVLRYSPYFSQGNDRIIVESDAVITKFSAENQTLHFDLPEYRNEREAEKQISQWQVALIDQNNQAVEIVQDVLEKDGLQIGRDFILESEVYNRTNGIAALSTAAGAAPAMPAISAKVDASTAEEMLHFWYQKADAKTREKFKQFVNQQ
ncbi:putative secreted protein [Vibrio ponticus]|nr:putative secreted protein [Vibrio ponticus]